MLEGSVRKSGSRVRITGQLIDAMTGAHRWAERYDRELYDVFAVQDEVARAIVAILAAHVNRAEIERALLKPPAAWAAYEYYLRGAPCAATPTEILAAAAVRHTAAQTRTRGSV